jgi:prepilin-type processing-associated H-X9-DG protein
VFRRSLIRVADITDGLSQTLMAAEKYVARRSYLDGKAINDDQHALVGYDIDTLRICHRDYPPVSDQSLAASDYSFGGPHPGGFQVAYADGSIAFKTFSTDIAILVSAANRHDGSVP